MKKYGREILLTISAFLALSILYQWQGLGHFVESLLHHLMVLLLALSLGFAAALVGIRKEIGIILRQHRHTDYKIRTSLSLFFLHRLDQLGQYREALNGNHGLDLDQEDLKRFVDACFTANEGRHYVGTDSNPPTRFYELYPTYINEQLKSLHSNKPRRDIRVLFVSEQELRADYIVDRVLFQNFFENHVLNDVQLLQVEKNVAQKLADAQRLPSTDLGIFGGRFVAFFIPKVQSGTTVIYTIYLKALDQELRVQLRQYMYMLNKYAKQIYWENDTVFFKDREATELGIMSIDYYGGLTNERQNLELQRR